MSNENTNPEHQLNECAMKAIKYASEALDAKAVDQAARALEVCKQAMELIEVKRRVDSMRGPHRP
jgi:phage gp46-like protein